MKIYHCPIERIPVRYTIDWVEQFEKGFKNNEIEFVTIGNTDLQPIETGSVLDCYASNTYKQKQLIELIELIKIGKITENDVIFFADAWFPGLESLFYIRNVSGINFKIAGILHAGSWDPYDFTSRTGMRNWAQHTELGWLHGIDMIFVATQWHKDLIVMNSADFDQDKIFVTGIPFYARELQFKHDTEPHEPVVKENIVVFPHRLDIEKHPEKFDRLAKKYPQWQFIKTMERNLTRDDYFKLLLRSKVMISFAEQETFGYSTVEAMALGNHVIVPDGLSYREIVPAENRYTSERKISDMLEKFMAMEDMAYYDLDKWADSIPKMLKVINVKMRDYSRRRKEIEDNVRAEQIRIEEEKILRKQKQEEFKKQENEVV